jgi:DegV family protein with EDD domain
MNKVSILTDSTAYLPDALLKQYAIEVIPLSIIWENETFRDGIDISPEDFYKRLATAKTMPTTSQATVGAMEAMFRSLLEKGRDVLGIFVSSKISGTCESAITARNNMPNVADRIVVHDSLTTIIDMGWQVLSAARRASAGEGLPACLKAAEQARDNSGVLFVVETLEFLRRGGRIGGAAAMLGTALSIKPVLEMREGRIESVDKVRTKVKALDRMLDVVGERIGGRTPVRVATAHADAEAEALALLEQAKARFAPIETYCLPLSPVIGAHVGPGTMALTYMAGVP